MPRLLDAFCRKGGAAAGYIRAGLDVVGVDIDDLNEAIPPAFAEFIGRQLLAQIEERAA